MVLELQCQHFKYCHRCIAFVHIFVYIRKFDFFSKFSLNFNLPKKKKLEENVEKGERMFIIEVIAHQTRFLGHRTVHNVINCAFFTTEMKKS